MPTSFPDPFDQNVLSEMPGTLSAFCQRICKAATPNFGADVVRLANRIEAKSISGNVIGSNGRVKTVRMNGEELLSMMIDADLSPGVAAEAPAAVHAALAGNVRPLLRVYDLDLASSRLSSQDLSFGLNAATNCADGQFPWAPGAPPSQRRAAINSAIAALPVGLARRVRELGGANRHCLLLRAVALAVGEHAARARAVSERPGARHQRRVRPPDADRERARGGARSSRRAG